MAGLVLFAFYSINGSTGAWMELVMDGRIGAYMTAEISMASGLGSGCGV